MTRPISHKVREHHATSNIFDPHALDYTRPRAEEPFARSHSDPAGAEEVAPMKAGYQKVEGVVSQLNSGLYTVKTSTGAPLTLTEAAAFRQGQDIPIVGDELTIWVNEGDMAIDSRPKGKLGKAPRFISGTLASIDHGKSQMTLPTSGGEKKYRLKPESRMFRNIAVGTLFTIQVNDREEVIDIHKDKK